MMGACIAEGACMAEDVHGGKGRVMCKVACVVGEGCVAGGVRRMQAGGKDPTGMLSCFII